MGDVGNASRDLPGHKRLTATRRLVIEKDAVAGIHIVAFAIVLGDVEGVGLGTGIGRARIERGCLCLRRFDHFAVQFRRRRLIEFCFQLCLPDTFENSDCAEGIDFAGIFRHVEGDPDMTLGAEIVDLFGLYIPEQRVY